MRPTRTIRGLKAEKAKYDGVMAIYEPVRGTLGPEPEKALIYRTHNRGSRIIDDGYILAEVQEPKDPFVRQVATTFKEACKRTNEKVGDATATTATFGGALFLELHKTLSEKSSVTALSSGKVSSNTLRRRILESAEVVKKAIMDSAITIDINNPKDLKHLEEIAIVSVGDEKVGKIIAGMAWKVGKDGFIDVVEGYKGELETELNEGFRFPAKIAAKAFMNNPSRYEMVAQDCPVLITDFNLDSLAEIGVTFQNINKSNAKLIVFAPSFSDDVLIDFTKGFEAGFTIHPVAVPSLRTEQFEDLAIYCGAEFISKKRGKKIQTVIPTDLGFLEKLIVKSVESKEDAVATGGRGTIKGKDKTLDIETGVITNKSKIEERKETLKGQLAETREENFKKLLERRIASMGSAVGVIKVGDSTNASSLDLKMKIEDAVYACKAALRGGYVKGGGLCLKEIAETLPEGDILKTALCAPYEQIQSSREGGIEIGPEIIDAAEAEFYAVEHATGVVANLITVKTITIEEEEISQGDGLMAIANMMKEFVITQKKHLGQLQENGEEMERDRLGGITTDERVMLDNG